MKEAQRPSYLQVNLYPGKRHWHMAVWIKRPGGRVPTTVRRFPDLTTSVPAGAPVSEVLDLLGGMVLQALEQVGPPRR